MLLETLTQNCCSCLECAVSLLCFGFLFFFSVFFISSIYEICRVCLGGRRACSSWSFLFFFCIVCRIFSSWGHDNDTTNAVNDVGKRWHSLPSLRLGFSLANFLSPVQHPIRLICTWYPISFCFSFSF